MANSGSIRNGWVASMAQQANNSNSGSECVCVLVTTHSGHPESFGIVMAMERADGGWYNIVFRESFASESRIGLLGLESSVLCLCMFAHMSKCRCICVCVLRSICERVV